MTIATPGWEAAPTVIQRNSPRATSLRRSRPRLSREEDRARSGSWTWMNDVLRARSMYETLANERRGRCFDRDWPAGRQAVRRPVRRAGRAGERLGDAARDARERAVVTGAVGRRGLAYQLGEARAERAERGTPDRQAH